LKSCPHFIDVKQIVTPLKWPNLHILSVTALFWNHEGGRRARN